MRSLILILAFAATPALAGHDRVPAPQDDRNSYWLDYKTDISEAKRELQSDLRRAKRPSDEREAWAEYRREIADAEHDYRKQMRDKGYVVGRVIVSED
jgi:hypothetical protein